MPVYRPKCCIFDLDGVIVETAHLHYKAWKKLADSLDITFGKKENELLKGLSRSKSLQAILALDDREIPNRKFQQLMDQKNGWYQDYIKKLTPKDILKGIPDFLDELQAMEIKLAIGSSSKNAQYILDYIKLDSTFKVVIDGTKIENSKPHPEVFLKGSEAFGIPSSDCLVFEDAVSGMEAAKAAGMKCVGVGDVENLNGADFVISSFDGLTPEKLFKQLDNAFRD